MTTANQEKRELKLLPHQFELINDNSTKVLGLCSGYGGGKTFAVARKAMTLMLQNPGVDGIVTEPNYPLLVQILIPELKAALETFGIPYTYNKADQIFYCQVSGRETRIICKSMEVYDRLIGINAAWVIMDEFDTAKSELAYSAYQKLLGRLRAGSVRQMVIVSTPEGFRAMHRIFVAERNDNTRLIKAKTTDNKHLPQDYIDLLYQTYPSELIGAYLNGEFVNLTSGTVYNSYNRVAHRSKETIRPGEPVFIGCDFNVSKQAATVYVKRNGGKEWHAVDELVDMYDTPEMCRIFADRFAGHEVFVYPDASGGSRKTTDASVSDIAIIEQSGFKIRANRKNPAVKDRILATNAAFEQGKLFINDSKCPTVARCLEQQAYDRNGEPDKTSGNDHQNDATTYPIAYEFPIRKPVTDIKISFAV